MSNCSPQVTYMVKRIIIYGRQPILLFDEMLKTV